MEKPKLDDNSELIQTFNELVKPLFDKILETEHEFSALVDIRDTLLPKLMSGEIEA